MKLLKNVHFCFERKLGHRAVMTTQFLLDIFYFRNLARAYSSFQNGIANQIVSKMDYAIAYVLRRWPKVTQALGTRLDGGH